jgi:hypothetical protein
MSARLTLLTLLALAAIAAPLRAAEPNVDLSRAVVISTPNLTKSTEKAVRMLVEEVDNRSMILWERVEKWPADKTPVIVVGPADAVHKLLTQQGLKLPAPAAKLAPEGYQIGALTEGATPIVYIAGNDARGVLFGVGRLLRELRLERQKVTLPGGFKETSAPQTPLRGHQLGYRPKTNSYDGWTVAMWEQYIRDLAVFGCNAIELIPPRSDDASDSPLFPLPPLRMMTAVSRLADEYGLDVWIWYPAMDRDYSDPKTVEFALKEWGEVFRALPRVDAVFVPGGDPGHTRPKVLFDLLEKQTSNLHKYHPKATMWMSPQSFTAPWMDEFYELIGKNPPWLSGIVFGPQVRVSLPKLRAAVPEKIRIRDYPDITHSVRCQYPVPDWDLALAMTEGREVCNPRPEHTARYFKYDRAHTFGFITYSEGCHDDVNKMIWSALGWNADADLATVLQQYGRYFIGPALGDRFAEGLAALERNWTGPVLNNAGIDETLKQFRALEAEAGPREKLNWRFQQALYRAYYDAYIRARLKHETGAMDAALAQLREAKTTGTMKAVAGAEAALDRVVKEPVATDLRARLGELAEGLFQSIRAQLSVKKYHAIALGRGANFDSVDVPLTDARWLRAELAAVSKLPDEPARLARLDEVLNRADPGPGGFYDNFGDPQRRPHLERGPGWEKDPGFYESPVTGFTVRGAAPPAYPRAWWSYAQTHYDTPLRARYNGLDPKATYRVRIVYGPQDGDRGKVRLSAGDGIEVHGYLSKSFEPAEFTVPAKAIVDGKLTLTWSQEPGAGGAGRGCQVAEVWLIKRPAGREP